MNKFILVFMPVLIIIAGCKDEAVINSKVEKTWNASVLKIKTVKLPINYKSIGSVVSDQRIDVSSRSTGFIRDILVLEGDEVSKEQLLISLDSSDVEGAIEQAKAAVNSAKLAVIDADVDVEMYKDLVTRGSVSENTMRKTQLFRDRAKDSLDEAETAHSTAKSQRQYIQILSEIQGVVVERHLRKGDLATPGKPILTIESSHELFFDTYVAESQISKMYKGAKVDVFIDALNQKVGGVVARVVPAGDSTTRRYKVKVALQNHDGLLSGMFGRVNFILGEKPAVVIPKSALIERGGLQGVFVVNENKEAHFRWLQLGTNNTDFIEVRAGLLANENIVLNANPQIHEGDFINYTSLLEHDGE
jgi:RND family efflux transporter MFP subunit|tara:strand:- start:4838 stop:5920 length:1083 start_codon:yes stop_codon:yes gene_type:complete